VFGSRSGEGIKTNADGLVGNKWNQNLWVYTADCMPIFFADKKTRNVATLHCGRNGLEKKIIKNLVKIFDNLGTSRDDLLVAIGPSISKEHYLVDKMTLKEFYRKAENKNITINLTKTEKDFCFNDLIHLKEQNLNQLDLKRSAYKQLLDENIPYTNIEISNLCTYKLKKELYFKLQEIERNLDKVWPEGKHERKLIETIWKLLLHGNDEAIKRKIIFYVDSNSMTLAKAALNSFSRINCPERQTISNIFFNKWKNNSVVLDSWFSFNASIETDDKTSGIEKLFENKFFDSKSPNTLRALLNTFVTRNSTFHAMDGSGYKYIAKKIIDFDKLNPIVISRFVKVFSRYNYYSDPYKSNMIETLNQIKKNKLSANTKEVLDAIIE